MGFRVDRKSFLSVLTKGSSFAGKNKVLPILECCRVRASENKRSVVISSTDGECSITVRGFAVDVIDDLDFCVNASDFIRSLGSLSDDFVIISLSEVSDSVLDITHSHGKMSLPLFDTSEYPSITLSDDVRTFSVDASLLRSWIDTARSFACVDTTLKPQMCGVYLYWHDRRFGVVASDGVVGFIDSVEYGEYDGGDELGVLLVNRAVSPALSLLSDTDNVKVSFDGVNLAFSTSDARLISRLSSMRYPRWRALIPRGHEKVVTMPKKVLNDVLKRALLFVDPRASVVKFDIRGAKMEVLSEHIEENKKMTETFDVSYNGEDITIGLKPDLLLSCLNATDSDKAEIRLENPHSSVWVYDKENPDRFVLTMPFMLT